MFKSRTVNTTIIMSFVGAIALLIIGALTFGINDAGYRTVIQYPNGNVNIKFEPGIYFTWFGKTTIYKDVITFDFDKEVISPKSVTLTTNGAGIQVRYQDGGTGNVFGKARFALPNNEKEMFLLHKEFRSGVGVAAKIIKSVTEESMNLTAGLMSSEEAYAEKRSTFSQWARDQISRGNFKTELKRIRTVDEATNKSVIKNVPVIAYNEKGLAEHEPSDLLKFGITVSGFQVTDWGFEPRTLQQIAAKREATMAIITAIANAERAKQDAITIKEQGIANVTQAKYEKEVEKERAVVQAEKEKEVAVIKAEQLVDVAEQQKLEAEQKKLAAVEYKEEQILRGEGDGEYKRLVIEADGALAQKLETYEHVHARYAGAVGQHKWVSDIAVGSCGANGSSGANGASNAMDLIELLTVKTAKDLSLDMSIVK